MIRSITPSDLPALKMIIDANELFPSAMLDEMTSDYLRQDSSNEFWLTDDDGGLVTIAYCAPEKMTEGTYNLYLIAVHPDRQGQGRGTAMMQHIEQMLANQGERLLLVETSALDGFAATQAFYRKCGYEEEARIREFYQAGEDKIIFRKALKS
ncbi:GNAT family N-acetyltransferase [filamentous cyanobacterium LEGE 11480]|uniref:GNAT family N-acetyltransferase n=1 Tax=Romeriopsis navalis LEGE 11480 TaxID=2777977 RepID=A0A928VKP0_9CYAN|nr:GNAT family N-acetyltransferase [Romeriopsis navalis]MBE9030358.1 GNAT family N-acetyltransferase [Romeriopsis navalis LEGE 11480]